MRTRQADRIRVVVFLLVPFLAVAVQVAEGQEPQKSQAVYVLRPHDKSVALPDKLGGLPVKIVDAIPDPPAARSEPLRPEELRAALTPSPELQMTAKDRKRLVEINRSLSMIRKSGAPAAAAPLCGNHEVIGTVLPGVPLQPSDTVGTWVTMPIAENGIQGLSGTLFTTFSNIAAQTLEVIGNYGTGNEALLSVFDWSCVDGKQGYSVANPSCDSDHPWFGKSQGDIPSHYKFYYWDCCKWQKAFALANKSSYVHFVVNLPFPGGQIVVTGYLNEAKILNWDTLKWDTYYSRIFQDRDLQPPRPWGPTAFLEFVSNSGCPDVPRLGFREVRFLSPGAPWTLAVPANTTMRFDLPDNYRYCLFDPNHTWCVCPK